MPTYWLTDQCDRACLLHTVRMLRIRGLRTCICGVSAVLMLCPTVLFYYVDKVTIIDKKHMLESVVDKLNAVPTNLTLSSKKAYDILLVGYMRGGTSFLGQMMGLRNESFFIYEPLHKMNAFGYYKPGFECSMMNKSCRRDNRTVNQALNAVQGIFNCDHNQYRDLIGQWQYLKNLGVLLSKNESWQLFFPECNGTWKGCPEKYLGRCSESSSRVTKVLRLSVSLAGKLIERLPNLKIIYLVRDPRAIMNSRGRLGWTPGPGGAVSLCNKMMEDYLESLKIKKVYPGRLYTVFYEEMATNPVKSLRTIYEFAGYDFNAAAQQRLALMTTSEAEAYPGNTYRHDSAKTARAWRNDMDTTVLRETNLACSGLYRLLGYPQLETLVDLNNTDIPLRIAE